MARSSASLATPTSWSRPGSARTRAPPARPSCRRAAAVRRPTPGACGRLPAGRLRPSCAAGSARRSSSRARRWWRTGSGITSPFGGSATTSRSGWTARWRPRGASATPCGCAPRSRSWSGTTSRSAATIACRRSWAGSTACASGANAGTSACPGPTSAGSSTAARWGWTPTGPSIRRPPRAVRSSRSTRQPASRSCSTPESWPCPRRRSAPATARSAFFWAPRTRFPTFCTRSRASPCSGPCPWAAIGRPW